MMRNIFRKNDGYTLLELLATMVAGSLVTLAAVTILFLGVRINRQSMDTASRQTTTRILLSSLEDLATQGTITKVASTLDSWKVFGTGNAILYSYDAQTRTIYVGGVEDDEGTSADETVAGKPIMEGVISSDITLAKQLLTVSVETEDGTYSSSVYCRMYVDQTEDSSDKEVENIFKPGTGSGIGTPEQSDDKPYIKFLKKLASQYSLDTGSVTIRNPGLILKNSESTGKYYSEWYIGSYAANPGWNANTPWCACFISWGLRYAEPGEEPLVSFGENYPKGFANVDSFMNYLKSNKQGHAWKSPEVYNEPKAGDLIFFDWKVNSIRDPEHVGAVIQVDQEGGWIYTIEGNSSNRVAVRKYKLTDPRIIGYGVLWPAESES